MNNTTIPLTPEELKVVETKYNKGITKLKKVLVIAPILGIVSLLTPPEFWNVIKIFDKKRSIRNLEDLTEPMYHSSTMIIIVILAVICSILLTYFAYVHYVKKDFNEKVKLRGDYKVVRVENLSKRVAENLDGLDTILHFEKNDTKIKKHLFKKSKNPELLNAKGITIEISKHSGIIFLERIIE
ncbi:hypothetical protein FF125_08270 [Aureibaculum algae]|uniref:Uncharacterized protein n=1 Tax=Aureibaculum algae TaxID=2584122 RepID=A0A5B7TP04_9FLAO|nr:hypothetical protein [Aureibaculum algae]QCX38425.1 hypothetical protein FF125_08270 [Aureibaculum algae]